MNLTKSFLALAFAAVLLTGCKKNETADATAAAAQTAKTETAAAEKPAVTGKLETASFHIEGMTCAVMCAAKIEKELAAMDGVQNAKVDFEKKTATIEYDNAKQTPEKFVAKVESVADGKTYKVSDVKTTADHAMLMTGDPVKDKKDAKKTGKESKKDKKSCGDAKESEKKPACCQAKKHCAMDEKKSM